MPPPLTRCNRRPTQLAASAFIVTACARPEATHPQATARPQDAPVGARVQDIPASAARYGDRAARLPAAPETLLGALAKAYEVNPQLNSQRAIVRQIDENVPMALADYRPHINAVASMGNQVTLQETVLAPGLNQKNTYWTAPRSISLTAEQKLFNVQRLSDGQPDPSGGKQRARGARDIAGD
jgi:outer membrane protein TolC